MKEIRSIGDILNESEQSFYDNFCTESKLKGPNTYVDTFSGLRAKYFLNWFDRYSEEYAEARRDQILEEVESILVGTVNNSKGQTKIKTFQVFREKLNKLRSKIRTYG